MTVILNLPPNIEEAFVGEAAARGMTPDEFVSQMVLLQAPWHFSSDDKAPSVHLGTEDGIPVLHASEPMAFSVIDDTINRIRRERDLHNFGL